MRDAQNRPLTVRETAKALGLSVHTVRAWISRRRLNHVRLGRAIRVLPEEIEMLLRKAAIPALETLHGEKCPCEPVALIRKKDAVGESSEQQIAGEQ